MNPTALALTGFITWFLILLGGIAGIRVHATLFKRKPANSFNPDGKDVSLLSGRLCRAHANCYEGFPFIGGLLLLALATNMTAITNPLALVLLSCRVAQSTIHVISTRNIAVQIRFAFFLAQIVIAASWAIQFLRAFAG